MTTDVAPRIGSLCSGYGGLDARFPGVPNHGDVTTTDWSQVEPLDWLTAGYPCQPFSHAGKRKGSADERHLWPAASGRCSTSGAWPHDR